MSHPVQKLDEVVHQRNRLGILAILSEASSVEFGFLKDALDLTDGNLSRHLQILTEAGHVELKKGYVGRRPRTWIRITKAGRRAFQAEIDTLRQVIERSDR